ncbi:GNAT family N-acetyltransferase [Micromonospora parathelypteridis]|uniref:GNAT superfamily N-acetyltransferase n=1 Tax=Micromonospora parathelypteridis TaxID=1839617 RepID=A0A840VGL2_9ACTN|nr:GNAT family N-acetyltransferase [Micromonospora parathelypteridis]MBB5475972.1 GNAT superfamily N-acetyltransferase [Micromonospora parathelypteridis]GGO32230.1 N-acetyltransferase [Micromonospora parathelypteridis]
MTRPVTVCHRRWDDRDAVALRTAMTGEMRQRYADRLSDPIHLPDAQAVAATSVAWTGVAYTADATPVGHAALRWHGPDLELKRMYVLPAHRGRGVAQALLDAIRETAGRLGAARIVLQTGDRQPDAIRRYEGAGYRPIPVFAPYDVLPYSRCFALVVRPSLTLPAKVPVPA